MIMPVVTVIEDGDGDGDGDNCNVGEVMMATMMAIMTLALMMVIERY